MAIACDKCKGRLESLTLYSPELLKIFVGGKKDYSRQGILSGWSICINSNCEDGRINIHNYKRRTED